MDAPQVNTTVFQTSTEDVDRKQLPYYMSGYKTPKTEPGTIPPKTDPGAKPPKTELCAKPKIEPRLELPEEDVPDDIAMYIKCRSIRIGSYRNHYDPQSVVKDDVPRLLVKIAPDQINFSIFSVDGLKEVNVCISNLVIAKMQLHFGKVLPVVFISVTSGYAAMLRNQLNMTSKGQVYFDPSSENETMKLITLLPFSINDELFTQIFRGEYEVLGQAAANEILIKSFFNTVPTPATTHNRIPALQPTGPAKPNPKKKKPTNRLWKLKRHMEDEIKYHKAQIKQHQEEIQRHKTRINALKEDE